MTRLLGRETRTVETPGPRGVRKLAGRSYRQAWALAFLSFCVAAGGCRGGQHAAHVSEQSQRGQGSIKQIAAAPVWPMARRDAANTGHTGACGPLTPRLRWISAKLGEPDDCARAFPAIASDGTIFCQWADSVSAVAPNGVERWTYHYVSGGYVGWAPPVIGPDGLLLLSTQRVN
jgi:hypothetical protein